MADLMGNTDVALVGCENYNRELVEEQVGRAFDLLGGPGAVAGEGESVFLKVNGLIPAAPERAITTHPEVVRAVVRQFKKVTGNITIGDSPGGPFNRMMLKRLYASSGFARVAEETGVSLNFDTSTAQKTVAGTKSMKSFALCRAMVEADHLVSISKFKTHLFMNITGAIKNLFGAVPGMMKFTYHSRFSKEEQFADLLVDVLLASGPDLHVVDAVEAMDGNGPRQGEIKKMGLIAAGRDALAVDTVLMEIIGIEPGANRALGAAIRRGLCTGDAGDINLLGDGLESLRFESFRLPDKKDITAHIPGFLMDRAGEWLSIRPSPDSHACTGCRKCEEICPAGAISMVDGLARVNKKKCIKCYCCHELCEHDAIELVSPALLRLVRRVGG